MNLFSEFDHFEKHFSRSPPVTTSSQKAQEAHATIVVEWLNLTQNLENHLDDMYKDNPPDVPEILNTALTSSETLFKRGDDISAWIGQMRIAEVAARVSPGLIAAHHLSLLSRYSLSVYRLEDADTHLNRMRLHFTDRDHPLAAEYWELKGKILRFNRKWMDAVPNFLMSLEHIEHTLPAELEKWFGMSRNDLIIRETLHIADCWINFGWELPPPERVRAAENARKWVEKVSHLQGQPMILYFFKLTMAELYLLEGRLGEAGKLLDSLIHRKSVSSQRAATLRPAVYCMLARMAEIEDDSRRMISHLSRAIAESSIYPNALQEFLVVDYALDLIRKKAVDLKQMEPFFEAMVIMLEAKDWYTGRDHSRSVAQLSSKLWANWLGKDGSKEEAEELYWAGYLHDIGKLLLPRSLLNKIAPLCKDEWKLLYLHPGYGKQILDALGVPRIAQLVSEHHQDIDGNGYPGNTPASPRGLCIAVSDFLEACTSQNRKYRRNRTVEEAFHILENLPDRRFPQGLIDIAKKIFT